MRPATTARKQKPGSIVRAKLSPRPRDSAFRFVLERHGIELQTMVDQPVAEAPRDIGLEPFNVFRLKFDHFARAQIDEMVVMAVGHLFVARAAIAEIMPFDDAGVLK